MELPNLTTDRKYVGELLYYFASIVAADSKISTSEVEFLKALGAKLGLPEQAVQNALDWTTKYLQLQKNTAGCRNGTGQHPSSLPDSRIKDPRNGCTTKISLFHISKLFSDEG